MEIQDYATAGGKNLIMEYIDRQPVKERTLILECRKLIRSRGVEAFSLLDTRQLRGKLYEIRIEQTRIMYVIRNGDLVYFLHICKKQKGRTERQEIHKAISRAKQAGML